MSFVLGWVGLGWVGLCYVRLGWAHLQWNEMGDFNTVYIASHKYLCLVVKKLLDQTENILDLYNFFIFKRSSLLCHKKNEE